MEGLYEAFLDAGYGPSLFWELSLPEIADLIKSRVKHIEHDIEKEQLQMKNMIILLWNQNRQLADLLSCFFDAKHKPSGIETYYPNMFDDELEADEEEQQRIACELHKARMEDFAYYHNKARKERGESNARSDT